MVGGRELALRLPLPLEEVWEKLQADVERLAGEAGLRSMQEILDDEVRQRVGSPLAYRSSEPCGAAAKEIVKPSFELLR